LKSEILDHRKTHRVKNQRGEKKKKQGGKRESLERSLKGGGKKDGKGSTNVQGPLKQLKKVVCRANKEFEKFGTIST